MTKNTNMTIKQQLYKKCQKFLDNRLKIIQATIADIQISLQSETKSSAGDKHETGRAMLQLEREKAGNQLAEIQKLIKTLHKVQPEIHHSVAALGSVVYTTQSNYFIAISAGEITVDNKKVYAISPSTPIGKLLIGKSVGGKIIFRESSFEITRVI